MGEVENDDIAHALVRFASGARGTLASSRIAHGRKNGLRVEVHGSAGMLWLDNERKSYEHWREEARRCQHEASTDQRVIDGIWTPKEAATFNLADQLREEIEAERPLTAPTMYTDLLSSALSEVDWQEVAAILLSELP